MAKFQKGEGGRPKGAKNKNTRVVQDFARSFLENPKAIKEQRAQYEQGKLHPAIVQMLYHYAYGKPKDVVELNTPKPIIVDLVTGPSND